MKKKKNNKDRDAIIAKQRRDMDKYDGNLAERDKERLERANEALRKCPPPKDWLQS